MNAAAGLNLHVSENVSRLMFRLRWNQRDLADKAGLPRATVSRRLRGSGWMLTEVSRIAAATGVTLAELVGALPDLATWDERRHSSPAGGGMDAKIRAGMANVLPPDVLAQISDLGVQREYRVSKGLDVADGLTEPDRDGVGVGHVEGHGVEGEQSRGGHSVDVDGHEPEANQ